MIEPHPDLSVLTGSDRRPLSRRLGITVSVIGGLLLVGVIFLWPRSEDLPDLSEFGFATQVVTAEVTEVAEGSCSFAADLECRRATFQLLEGPEAGSVTNEEWQLVPSSPVFQEGDRALLNVVPEAPPLERYQFADRERRPVLVAVAAIFVGAVILLGKRKGLAAVAALAVSIWAVLVFIVPAILTGRPPEPVAIVGGGIIALTSIYLTHGWRNLTHVAALGTFGAVTLTVVISALVTRLADLSGFVSEEASFIILLETVDLRGLILAGMVLGALGALDDVTITQASAVWEVNQANPALDRRQLAAAGMRVGRDHVAASVNTLLLAYVGASLPLLLLFALSGLPLSVVANSEVVAVEIIRTLVGSIGLVAAVPLTTWLAARVAAAGN